MSTGRVFPALAFLIFLASTGRADDKTFDCKMRQLALEFAHKIQPNRTAAQFQELADALNGAPEAHGLCNVSIDSFRDQLTANRRFPYLKVTSPDASTFYVDATKGSDSGTGDAAHPFKTIAHALDAASKASSPVTIVLRAGTFYVSETLNLSPQHSGVTIMNYQGEEAWISGGVPLTGVTWKPYNTSGQNMWTHQMNQNNVYGQHPNGVNIFMNGTYDNWQACEAACKANGSCRSWTWHDQNQFDFMLGEEMGQYKYQCWFRYDNVWSLTPEGGHVSGHFTASPNIYMADLSSLSLSEITGLRVNGKRAIRARYPNADPELGFGSNLQADSWLKPTLPTNPDREVSPDVPLRTTGSSFQKYQLGVGGPCMNFDPPAGYWCGNETSGGGHFTYRVPAGMVASTKTLPNSPYKNATGAVVQAWRPAHWASWMFEVGEYDSSSGTFHFSKGGFQGARGNDRGDNFYIENVFEELDSPGEFYFNPVTKTIYLWYNDTGAPPATTLVVATHTKVLINITGTQDKPVTGVNLKGLGFRDTAYTYLDPHGMPSGGDWGLQRTGAIFIQGTEESVIDSCIFERLDGNAVVISGYNRYATIHNCEFMWIGDSAIVSWGNAVGANVPGMGWDGTNGDQPRYNQILNNFVHELGINEKQSSFYFQAKSCLNHLQGNIFFNGPRAGINFNDGFGGGSNLTENLLLNTCRESGDHGPFNSWDRQVYVTKVKNGTASPDKQYDYIYNNFMIANYNSQEAIDNDDGSCYYETHHNFFAYSGNGMKNDFGGHDNHHHDNVYAYVGHGFGICSQLEGHEDYFYNNAVVLRQDGDYGHGTCSGPGMTVVHDNQIFTPNGTVTECGKSLEEWQKAGNDRGTTANKWPDDDKLLDLAKTALNM